MLPLSYGAVLLWMAVAYQLMASSNAQNNVAPGYLGCFLDKRLRSLGGDTTTSSILSVEWCFHYCLSKAYKYAGVESKTECYCGDNEDYDKHGSAADSKCRHNTCPGNSNQFCGGHWRLAIYRISDGVCNNTNGPPDHGTRKVTNPTHVSFNLDNFKFVGTRVRFECNTGYTLQGAETIECTQSGNIATWSDSVPSCTATSLLPNQTDTMNRTDTSTTAYNTNVIISGAPSVSPDATDGPVMSDTQTSQTGTLVGTVAGVIAAVILLLVIFIIIFRRRGNMRNASSDVAMVDVTSSINQTQGDSDVTTEPNQASTIPVYSQVTRNQTKNENDHVYANADGVTNSAANPGYEVHLDVRPSLNEHDNETGLVDNIVYDSSSPLKDESEMGKNDLNEKDAGALTTTEGQPGWVENIIYE